MIVVTCGSCLATCFTAGFGSTSPCYGWQTTLYRVAEVLVPLWAASLVFVLPSASHLPALWNVWVASNQRSCVQLIALFCTALDLQLYTHLQLGSHGPCLTVGPNGTLPALSG
ncbi:hypothetical protein COO60DRAFT_397058 [Scenedesmus sp. NREL 46B-D3]|nr:hypothetical protein COO60DRAFT_397058 [Scenedesmus sp. NREL 46B-D3]